MNAKRQTKTAGRKSTAKADPDTTSSRATTQVDTKAAAAGKAAGVTYLVGGVRVDPHGNPVEDH